MTLDISNYNNSVRSNNQSLKYRRFTPLGCKDIGKRKSKFVVKTEILSSKKALIANVFSENFLIKNKVHWKKLIKIN